MIARQSLETMKILVVHRQKDVIDQITKKLEDKDFAILHLQSGLDGLFTSRIERFDLIICDVDLPVISGFELIRSMRTYSVNRTVPVIFVSGEIDPKSDNLRRALGVTCFITGDKIESDLHVAVRDHINQWELNTQLEA